MDFIRMAGGMLKVIVSTLKSIDFIWLVVEPYPSEKYEFVSWDDDIPNIWQNKIHVPNQQPVTMNH